jgi:UDP-glucose:(heptosyl)LPS alpha-1,3-glucosyltransferase
MKIALVILHADPMRGGAECYTIDLSAALTRRGHDVALVATSFGDVPAGVTRVSLGAAGRTRARRYRAALDSLDAHLDATRYDIVHAMFPVRHCDVYHPHAGLAVAAVAERPLAALFNPRRRLMSQVEQALLRGRNPPRVLCLSDYVRRSVRQHYQLADTHLPTLFNAVDLGRFDPQSWSESRRRIRTEHGIRDTQLLALMVAQDYERKGLGQAIAALHLLPERDDRNWERFILGLVGRQRPGKYEALALRKDVHEQFRYMGSTSEPQAYYAAADFFVLPTKHDPCSLVVLEALAMGLPVISTRFNGACEIMTDGVHGFVLPDPQDVGALAQAMRKMIDPQLRARMSAACLELRPKLSHEQHLERLIQIYQQVMVR